jgi:hypothetical protein
MLQSPLGFLSMNAHQALLPTSGVRPRPEAQAEMLRSAMLNKPNESNLCVVVIPVSVKVTPQSF